MQKTIDDLKRRVKSLENTLQQNKVDFAEEKDRHKEALNAKKKEFSILKNEVDQLNQLLKDSKSRDSEQNQELEIKYKTMQEKLIQAEVAFSWKISSHVRIQIPGIINLMRFLEKSLGFQFRKIPQLF